MNLVTEAYQYILANPDRFWDAVQTHLILSVTAFSIAAVFGIVLGVWVAKQERAAQPVLSLVNALRVVPSLAILALVMPFLGTGWKPALLALILMALPSVLINTTLGFKQVPADVLEAARGMGLDENQVLWNIEFPFSLPAILTGLRTASIEIVAGATLAAFIGGGGMGVFIINGLSMYAFPLLLVGAVPVAMMAVLLEVFFSLLNKLLTKTPTQVASLAPC